MTATPSNPKAAHRASPPGAIPRSRRRASAREPGSASGPREPLPGIGRRTVAALRDRRTRGQRKGTDRGRGGQALPPHSARHCNDFRITHYCRGMLGWARRSAPLLCRINPGRNAVISGIRADGLCHSCSTAKLIGCCRPAPMLHQPRRIDLSSMPCEAAAFGICATCSSGLLRRPIGSVGRGS